MKIQAIVYTSQHGHTRRYANLLGEKLNLPVYSLREAKLPKGSNVIYMGWLFAAHIKGYRKAARRYHVKALCGVGLCPTGEMLAEIRTAEKLTEKMPLFTLQGGMEYSQLRGINKMMIDMLIKMLSAKQDASAEEKAMLDMIRAGGDFVSKEHLSSVIEWYSITNTSEPDLNR